MSEKHFYVSSDSCKEYYPNNTWREFTYLLPKPLKLRTSTQQKWYICLKRIGISSRLKLTQKILKIQCLDIRKQHTNDSYTYDLEKISLNKHKTYDFYEIENPIYIPLNTNEIFSLSFRITDIENNLPDPLDITFVIQPTILEISIKQMNFYQKSFNLTLTKNDLNYNNEMNIILKNPLNFKTSNWKVGLKNLVLPSYIRAFPKDFLNMYHWVSDSNLKTFKIPNSTYTTISLFNVIKGILEKNTSMNAHLDQDMHVNLSYKNKSMESGVIGVEYIYFDLELAKILGVCDECDNSKIIKLPHIRSDETFRFKRPINIMMYKEPIVLVQCNIVDLQNFNDNFLPILKIMNINPSEKTNVNSYKNIEYKKLNQNYISEIKMKFTTQNNEPITFDKGFFLADLHFTNTSI